MSIMHYETDTMTSW